MEDLIKEEEFLPQKNTYNPWKNFAVFYAIAFGELILFFVFMLFFKQYMTSFWIGVIGLFLPLITAFCMFFSKKENAFLPSKTIILGVALLMCVFYFPMITIAMSKSSDFGFGVIVIVVNVVLSCAVILPISGYKKRKAKYKSINL